MDSLGHYIRIHLTGSAGGIELFGRGKAHLDPKARQVLDHIRGELVAERRQLLDIADHLDVRPAPLSAVGAAVGERISRLKPNGGLIRRTDLDDLVDLEMMRVALSGKIAGWEALLAAADQRPALPADQFQGLLDQACRQLDQVSDLHRSAARRALAS